MINNKLMELINLQLDENERIFYFRNSCLYDSLKKFSVEFLINYIDYDNKLNDVLKNKLEKIVLSIIKTNLTNGEEIKVKIIYTKTNSENSNIINKIINYMQTCHHNYYQFFVGEDKYKINQDGDIYVIKINLEKIPYEFAINTRLDEEIKEALNTEIIEDTKIYFNFSGEDSYSDLDILNNSSSLLNNSSNRYIQFEIVNKITKVFTENMAKYIIDVLDKTENDTVVTVCGKIEEIKEKVTNKNEISKTFLIVTINDNTSSINCIVFPNSKNMEIYQKYLVVGQKIAVYGSYKNDTRFKSKDIICKNICVCDYNEADIDIKKDFNKDLGAYIYLTPNKYEEYNQDTLENHYISPKLMENTYVVFDLETTGLLNDDPKIVEIAALKIENGKFTEYVSTLINPGIHIPEKASVTNHIYDDDVRLCHKFEEIVPDFYRFTKDCILVGHNIKLFDIPVLNKNSLSFKYEFNNEIFDTLLYAQSTFNFKKNDLSTLASKYGIINENAHRALSDVVTNAKLFLKFINNELPNN